MQSIFERLDVAEEMVQLQRYMRGLVTSPLFLLSQPGRYILTAGGKRIRAAIVFLTASLYGRPVPESAIYAAAAVELVHAASLVHDDLIDQSPHRRGLATIHEKWHHDVALLTGDYLFALSAQAIAQGRDIRVLKHIGDAAVAICEGEISGVDQVEPLEEALQSYRFKIGQKTAVLFEAAAKVGAACAGAPEGVIEGLGRYGYALGMAFQIVDDVLDYVGDEGVLGKPVGGDFRRGLITLPLIYAVACEDGGDSLRGIVARFGDTLQPEEIELAIRAVQSSPGPQRARWEAERYQREALAYLQVIADSPVYASLEEIACRAVDREQ